MTTFTSLGAINKLTGDYVYPRIANKKDTYSCPDCSKDLVFCQGTVRTPYFRHKKEGNNPCVRYSTPSESQVHKDCKLQLKTLLENKTPLTFVRKCCDCREEETFDIPEVSDHSKIHREYRFDYQGPKVADVAYLDDGAILCIFEVCNTHRTLEEARPEPWFEVDAASFISLVNSGPTGRLEVPCIRVKKCEDCTLRDREREKLKAQESRLRKEKQILATYEKRLTVVMYELTLCGDDTSDDHMSLRLSSQKRRLLDDIKTLKKFLNAGVPYVEDSSGIKLCHPSTGTSVRRTLNSGKTFYKGKWWECITISDLIDWYKSDGDTILNSVLPSWYNLRL